MVVCLPVLFGRQRRPNRPLRTIRPIVPVAARTHTPPWARGRRKVDVAWNRFYDHAGLSEILARLHQAFPDLTKLYSIGQSTEGRDLWCLEVTARSVGNPDRKPGMFVDGNIHGNEVQAGEVVVYTAWYLCHQYAGSSASPPCSTTTCSTSCRCQPRRAGQLAVHRHGAVSSRTGSARRSTTTATASPTRTIARTSTATESSP
jgi:hypothetical protein